MYRLMKCTFVLFLVIALTPALLAQDVDAQLRGHQVTFFGYVSEDQVNTPVVPSASSGHYFLDFSGRLQRVRYNVTIYNGTAFAQGHLHCGAAGTGGPIVAFLFNFGGIQDVNGTAGSGILTNADIIAQDGTNPDCPLVINNVASLLAAIRKDMIYVNLHSAANPAGELRDQIFPAAIP